ncbi:helix-turn-helix domain-containing protein [Brevibacterium sp.]|uniref:helix-turn-helix domain-containing protein n=1 Tax=Brevibacterium sp. TaxID=1701 RepID=UPI00281285A7|nr:helix-turn-helix domain-containing protein [Brevibacterium sp.]
MFTEPELDQLEARYREGASVYALAKEFHCHRETVANKLKARGVEMRGNKTTPAQVATMLKLAEAGWSKAEIAENVGVAEKTVAQYLRQAGLTFARKSISDFHTVGQ